MTMGNNSSVLLVILHEVAGTPAAGSMGLLSIVILRTLTVILHEVAGSIAVADRAFNPPLLNPSMALYLLG